MKTSADKVDDMRDILISGEETVREIIKAKKCFFYDTCSLRYHAGLDSDCSNRILDFIHKEKGIIIITETIMMEIGQEEGKVEESILEYLRNAADKDVKMLLLDEKYVFDIMSICFATNEVVNSMLMWAVRNTRRTMDTMDRVLSSDIKLYNRLIRGKGINDKDIYETFFESVRNSREKGDNLGEQLLAIIMYILSNLPGDPNGKYCVFTDDKGAAGMMDTLFNKTPKNSERKKMVICSTPKLAQLMHNRKMLKDADEIKRMLSFSEGNIRVLGTSLYDIRSRLISMDAGELVEEIHDGKVHVTF